MVFLQKLASINFSDGFHLEEKFRANENSFHYTENAFPPAGMKDFAERYFSTRRKKTDRSLWKMEKKMVSTSWKIPFPYQE